MLSDTPVSYTHLDVYKRQGTFPRRLVSVISKSERQKTRQPSSERSDFLILTVLKLAAQHRKRCRISQQNVAHKLVSDKVASVVGELCFIE